MIRAGLEAVDLSPGKMKDLILVLIFATGIEGATIDDTIQSCLFEILTKYFPHQSILMITDLTIEPTEFRRHLLPDLPRENHRELIGDVMRDQKWTVQIYNTDKYIGLPPRIKLKRLKNSVLFIRPEIMASDELFDLEMIRLYQNPLWNPSGRTLIVLKGPGNDSARLAKRVIQNMWTKSKAVDSLVMVAEEGSIHLYTWFPYRQPDCSRVREVVKVDTYTKSGWALGGELYPAKVKKNLEGCELVAATETCIPYVFADEKNASLFVDGFEYNIFTTLSSVMNFRLRTIRPRYMWTTSINKTVVGAFRLLVEQRVDLAFSCLMLTRERYLLASALPSYYEDSLVWFVPGPTFQTHAFDIFLSFSREFWLLMTAILFSAMAVVVALARARGANAVVRVALKLIGMSLYGPVTVPARKCNFRLFVFLFFLYSMHITIAFQSSLFSLYRQPHFNKIYRSLEEAVDDELFVYLRSASRGLYNQSDHALWKRILRPKRFGYLSNFGEAFSEIAYDKTAIALYIKTTGIYMISVYFTDEFGTPQILWLKEKFATYPVTTFLSPGNPLYHIFEMEVLWLLGSGLIRVWLERATKSMKLNFDMEGFLHTPLSMSHLGGAFLLLLLLLSAAVCTFIGEVVVYRVFEKTEERRKPPHRHFYIPVKPGRINTDKI